jgi:hypothetical protein
METKYTYSVNGKGFNSFLTAIAYAKPLNANVVQNDNGFTRWSPAPAAKARKVRHMLVNADGTKTEFSKVRR